nr:MAG: polyprotein [Aedes vexans iflavirus]
MVTNLEETKANIYKMKSYSEIVKSGPCKPNPEQWSRKITNKVKPQPKVDMKFIDAVFDKLIVYECKRDYSRALSHFYDRCRQADELICAIAARLISKRIFVPEMIGEFRYKTPKLEKVKPKRIHRKPKIVARKKREDIDALIKSFKGIPFQGLRKPKTVSLFKVFSANSNARILFSSLLMKMASSKLVEWSPEPQMENPITVSAGNTTPASSKTSTHIEDPIVKAEKASSKSMGFYDFASSVEAPTFSRFTDKWIYVATVPWKTTHTLSEEIWQSVMLEKIIKDNIKAQAFALIMQHKLYRCNIRVRFSLTSNKFQTGCLVASSLYTDKAADFRYYTSVYSALQRNNVRLYAGSDLNAELVIPYRFVDSSMTLQDKTGFCRLALQVLTPLATVSKTATQCNVAVHVALEDVKVNGMCARYDDSDVEPQMDTIGSIANLALDPSINNAINAATSVLSTIGGDRNRDDPPIPLQPMTFIPQGNGSIAFTNNAVEPIAVLRADAAGQTPRCFDSDDMSLSRIMRVWSLIKQQKLTAQSTGQLFVLQAVPVPKTVAFPDSGRVLGIQIGTPTALAFGASFYSYWRGNIEFKMEFVMSSYHKGKIMVSCIPLSVDNVDIKKAKMSVNQVYDIQDPGEKIFICPWQWRNSFCRVRSVSYENDVPSSVYFHIVNPIIAIDGVPPEITMNVYIRAGDNFEVAIPRPSVYSSMYTQHIVPPTSQSPTPYNLESAWFLTYNSDCKGAQGRYPLVPYIQNVVNGFVGYTNLRQGLLYKVEKTRKGRYFRIKTSRGVILQYGTYDPALSTSRAHGMIMGSMASMKAYIQKAKTSVEQARDLVTEYWEANGPWSEVSVDNVNWTQATDQEDPPVWVEINIGLEDDFDMIEPQMETPTTVKLVKSAPKSNFGLTIFGEECPDHKSASHRYEFLGMLKDVARWQGMPQNLPYSGEIRVHPICQADPESSAVWTNRNMEGAISTRARAFRGWRGGIRYRFVVIGNPPEGSMMYVSFLHDRLSTSTAPIAKGKQSIRDRFDLLNTQYASHMQALRVNQIFTVEVPYYSEKEFLSLYDSSDRTMSDNGSLLFWVVTPKEADIHLQVFYSLADDCRFYEFIGVPRCYDLSSMAPEPQMEEPEATSTNEEQSKPGVFKRAIGFVKDTFSAPATISEAVSKASQSHVEVVGDIKETLNKVKELAAEFSDKVLSTFNAITIPEGKEVKDWTTLFGGLSSVAFEMVSHLLYAVIGGTKAVVCFAIFNLLRVILGVSASALSTVTGFVSRIWSSFRRSPEQLSQGQPEPQMEDEDIVGFGTLIFTSISTMCGVKATPPSNMSKLAHGLFCFSNSARQGNNVGHFLKDNIVFIKRVFASFMDLFSTPKNDYELIAGVNDTRLRDWMVEVSFLISPVNENLVTTNPNWIQKVFEMAMVGRAMALTTTFSEPSNQRLAAVVQSYLRELKKLEEALVNRKVYSSVRYEPFCLWLAGKAGTGKTTVANLAADRFAEACNYQGTASYHPMSAGQKYMDGLTDQPTIFVDDALCMDLANDTIFVSLMLNGKSSAVLRLPYSRVDDKDRLCNFQNMIFSSNFTYFNNVVGVHDSEAFNRRRDLLLYFDYAYKKSATGEILKEQYCYEDVKRMLNDPLQRDFIVQMEHLDVYKCDPMVESRELIKRTQGQSYADTVMRVIMQAHTNYHKLESRKYRERYARTNERLAESERSGLCFDDQLKEYKEVFESFNREVRGSLDLSRWTKKCQIACGRNDSLLPEPQNGEGEAEPQIKAGSLSVEYVTPFGTEMGTDALCLHHLIKPSDCCYDPALKWFTSMSRTTPGKGAPDGVCKIKQASGLVTDAGGCMFNNPEQKRAFMRLFMYSGYHSDEVRRYRDSGLPYEQLPGMILTKEMCDSIPQIKPTQMTPEISILDAAQRQIRSSHEVVGDRLFNIAKGIAFIAGGLFYTLVQVFKLLWQVFEAVGYIAAGVIGLIVTYKMFFSSGSGDEEPQIHPSGDYSTLKSNQKTIRQRTINLCKGATPNINLEDIEGPKSSLDGVLNKISSNTVIVIGKYTEDGVERIARARCLALHTRTLLVLRHYFEFFKYKNVEKVTVVSRKGDCSVEYGLDELQFMWSDDCGYGTCELPQSYPVNFKKITQLICSDKFSRCYPSNMMIVEHNFSNLHTLEVQAKVMSESKKIPQQPGMSSWVIHDGFEYAWGGKGKCGSLLLVPSLSSPIVGIHSAGVKDVRGFAEVLFRETFEEPKNIVEFVEPQLDNRDNVYGLDGFYSQEGALDYDFVPHSSSETAIRPSLISGVFPVTTEPAPLSSKDERLSEKLDIMKIGVSRRCDPIKEFDKVDVYLANKDYEEKVLNEVKPMRTPVEPLSIAQAIEGLPIEGMAEPIQMSTSEGFPWRNMRPPNCSNKSWMFKLSSYSNGRMKVEGVCKELKEVLDYKQSLREKGRVPCSYFTTCLKDSRVLKEKVPIPGKTRVFEMSPIELTIAQRQYFYDYISSFINSRFEHTIGINPDGYEWTELANSLTSFSPHILTADYSAYGPRLSINLLKLAFSTATKWCEKNEECSEEEAMTRSLVRECIKNEVSHGLHIVKDLVFRPSSGLPSGNCETVNKNTECNSRYIRIAFLGIMREKAPHYAEMYWFDKMVRMYSNGDDLIMAVKPQIIEWFNNVTLIDFFAKYNLKMTDALKSGKVRPYCSIEEATYLKRGFLPHPTREGHWLAPLEKASITDTANWVWKSPDMKAASLVNSEMCCRLSYSHGPKFYNEICEAIKRAWKDKGVNFEYPSWNLIDNHIWDGAEGPKYCF